MDEPSDRASAVTPGDSRPPGSLRDGLVYGALGAATTFVIVLILGGVVLGMGFRPSEAERAALAEARSENLDPAGVARLYAVRCASCHGPTGQGLIGPGFVNISARLSEEEHLDVVRNGRNTMPAFGTVLLEAEIAAVVDYERTVLSARR